MVSVPAGSPIVYVSFSADINSQTTESLLAVFADCANQGVQKVYLMLSTSGGNVMNGINLYNAMRAMPFELTIHNVGNVNSVGNVIFLAGEHRYACPHSTFMFHGVHWTFEAGSQNVRSLWEVLASLLADEERMGNIIAERTNLKAESIVGLFAEAQTKDATYAVSSGIIHGIRDVDIPQGSPLVTLVFQR